MATEMGMEMEMFAEAHQYLIDVLRSHAIPVPCHLCQKGDRSVWALDELLPRDLEHLILVQSPLHRTADHDA